MSLTPAFMFKGMTNCMDCGKAMGVNDQGIYYNVSHKAVMDGGQDLMFCIPCAWRVTHAMVADLVKLVNQELAIIPNSKGAKHTREYVEVYEKLAKAVHGWADIQEEIEGVTKNAVRK